MQGRLLRVNLSTREIGVEGIPEQYLRDYLGGSGLAAKYLYDELPAGSSALGEENKLFFSIGPLNGGYFPTSGRYNVSCRSPLTGLWLDSSSSGKFGYYMGRAGYMAIIIEGQSDQPVYLYINNDTVEIKDAASIWGKTISESIQLIEKESQVKGSAAAIGPSGEKLVPMACIINDGGRAAGRGGAGAVMGSKKLKAVFVSGDRKFEAADPDAWRKVIRELTGKVVEHPLTNSLKTYGTGVAMGLATQSGDAPTKNWQLGNWEGYGKISGMTMASTMLRQHSPECHVCPIQCARYVEIEEGPYAMKGSGPEYETLGSFGSMLLNDDLESIAYMNLLCNEYGIDTISSGSSIAFAMEAYEKGMLSQEDLNGIDLTWGNTEAVLAVLRLILNQEGIGKLLGQGVKKAAQVIGQGSEEFAIHVKGMELPMHDPRAFFGFGPTYATSPRGGCHCHGYLGAFEGRNPIPEAGINEIQDRHATSGKGILAKAVQDVSTAVHSAIVCIFTFYSLSASDLARAINAATGFSYTGEDILKIGERIFNLQRAFNSRFGSSGADDTLPPRVLSSTIGGPVEGLVPNLEEQLQEYYQARGWDSAGKPSQAKLEDLGLDYVIGELYG